METIDDDDGDYALKMKKMQPSTKRRIAEQDVSSIHHSLSSLDFKPKREINQRIGKKRKFTEMDDDMGCKDNMNKLHRDLKRIKLWKPKTNKRFDDSVNDMQNEMDLSQNEAEIKSGSELIPSNIQYAEFTNNHHDHPLIHTLYRNDSVLHGTLNERNGALVKYKEPRDSWRELIEKCCTNEGDSCCGIGKLQLKDLSDENEDIRMKESKKKRPIRLHTSYSFNGVRTNHKINSTELKKMANKCYVSTLNKDK